MKLTIGLMAALLLMTGCACAKQSKKDVAVRKALKETRVRYDYAVDQNQRYSKQVKRLTIENRKLKKGK